MKTYKLITLLSALLLPLSGLVAAQITIEFQGIADYTDFSVSGMSEEKTLPILEGELESDLEVWAKKYLQEGQSLHIVVSDIDMAGDIQPWRNRHNADIRYVERIYIPRMKLSYTLKDAEDKVLAEGEESISDLDFQDNSLAAMRGSFETFFYEREMLGNWIRQTFRK